MAATSVLPSYGGSATFTISNATAKQLSAKIAVVDPNLTNHSSVLSIANDGASVGNVLIGGPSLAKDATQYGIVLAPGDSYNFPNGSNLNVLSTLDKYIACDNATPATVHVLLVVS